MQATLNGRHSNGHSLMIDPALTSSLSTYVNPSQILSQSSQIGSSSSELFTAQLKKRSSTNAKRKRLNTPEKHGDSSSQQHKNRDKPKKKKANRACFHCQKAHLTCDDSRPCQRCVKRGMQNTCIEGHRKKAKYLLDEDELEQLKRGKSTASENCPEAPSITTCEPFPSTESLFDVTFDTNFQFGSEAANGEYSILSAILGTSSPTERQTTPPPQLQYSQSLSDPSWPATSLSQHPYGQSSQLGNENTSPYAELSMQPSDQGLSSSTMSSNFVTSYPHTQYPQQLSPPQEPQLQYTSHYRPQPHLHALQQQYPSATNMAQNPLKETFSGTIISPALSHHSPTSSTSAPLGCSDPTAGGTPVSSIPHYSQLQNINDRVITPYDFTEGYHFLMKHLPTRFEKNDILRIVRALAIYRPSLIALQMPLSVDDEVFVERCFQRSLLELDKLISFSGTPTVVWRRTGEICLVAPEFSLLTEWPMEDLVGKYIYELFENQSVVEYFESFALHAFENTTKSVNSHCVLLKPSGGPIPCTFCFSVRRDLFDLPSHVIGQWLPLL